MTCREMSPLLPRIAERDGSPRVALDTARHLAYCAGCAAELLRLREINGLLDSLPPREVPDSFPGRILRAIRSKGGGVLALVVLGGLAAIGATVSSGSRADAFSSAIMDPLEAAGTMLSALL